MIKDAQVPAIAEPRLHETLVTPARVLMAPGPTNLPPAVLQALASPLTGHKDPVYLRVMDETADLLRQVFRTRNSVTLALPGTGGAGMEACLVNVLEPGDRVLIGVNGLFAERMVEIGRRCGAEVVEITAEWGRIIEPESVERALAAKPTKLVALVHGETSTGVLQPVADVARLVHDHGALLALDTVATLGGIEVASDDWDLDLCYSGSQKCLSAPPGAAPLTVSDRAMAAIAARKTPVASWYYDLSLHEKYWHGERIYHHTAPVLTMYALREACRLTVEEGLDERQERHERLFGALVAGLEALGLQLFAPAEYRLPTVAAVRVPEGVNDARVRGILLDDFNIEIAGGLGAFAGRMWRIGIMGYSASEANVVLILAALEHALRSEGKRVEGGAGVAAAMAALAA
ncbi:MAG TPA: alanine--glyoxylate aminotransferase family protein [Chloroflexota bacterium]|jgi:alanine-glyoxylate transaminase/serine-glyoxylate transaminase/serine-pyruvate transaminase